MEHVKRCPLCNHKDLTMLYEKEFAYPEKVETTSQVRYKAVFDRFLVTEEPVKFQTMMCRECGLAFINPRLTEDENREKYSWFSALRTEDEWETLYSSTSHNNRTRIVYDLLMRTVARNRLSILDFGGSSGLSLAPFVQDNQCYVVDLEECQMPAGVEFLGRSMDDVPDDMKFDVILCCRVLEHVPDVGRLNLKLVSHLRSGGVLHLEVPQQYFMRDFKKLVDPTTHINFFSPSSLRYLSKLSGMTIKSTRNSLWWLLHSRLSCISVTSQKTIVQPFSPNHSYRNTRIEMVKNLPLHYLPLVIGRLNGSNGTETLSKGDKTVECPVCHSTLDQELDNSFYYCGKCQLATREDADMPMLGTNWFSEEWASAPGTIREFKQRVGYALKLISKLDGVKSVLDVGCGNGTLVHELIDRGYSVFGIDTSDEAITIARNKHKWSFRTGSLDTTVFARKFDLIVSMNLIEHLQNPKSFVRQIKQNLRPNGYVYLETPNLASWSRKVGWRKGFGIIHQNTDHRNCFKLQGLIKLLEGEGFKVQKATTRTLPNRMLVKSTGAIITKAKGIAKWDDSSRLTPTVKALIASFYRLLDRCPTLVYLFLWLPAKLSQSGDRGILSVVIGRLSNGE